MKILVLAPHADDEVLGVGGSIAKAAAEGSSVVVAILTGPGDGVHPIWPNEMWVNIRKEAQTACDVLGVSKLIFRNLPAACLDVTPAWQVNRVVSELIAEVEPDEIYIPFSHDMHKDHGVLAYAALVGTRPYLDSAKNIRRVLAYETLSETHLAPPYLYPAFQPNVFVDISEYLEIKLEAMRKYESQVQENRLPRSIEALKALAKFRGTHVGVEAAEAFILLRETIR